MNTPSGARLLDQLAREYGVQTAYYDVTGHRRVASQEALLAILQCLGAAIAGPKDAPNALVKRHRSLWDQPLEPVAVTWDGGSGALEVRLPARAADVPLVVRLVLETGEERRWEWWGDQLPTLRSAEVEGNPYVAKEIPLPSGLPWGYHKLTLEMLGRISQSLVISAPMRAFTPSNGSNGRSWGGFLPLYALHSRRSWGAGDLSDMEQLMTWIADRGGSLVGTLPLLATFLKEPFDPSPYTPVSRLLWNEFFLDAARLPEMELCPSARALMESSTFQKEVAALRKAPLVDYRRQMALKRRLLEKLAACCFAEPSSRGEALHQFAASNPIVDDYARFVAATEKQHVTWQRWPEHLRRGDLQQGDYDEETRRYHLYVQWNMHQQMESLAEKGRRSKVSLYLDLPLGVHSDGYDTWREQGLFVRGAAAGAPPDFFFTLGQNWGIPPLHPHESRQQGHRYFIACLRHHLRYAGALRIDHLMGLHRLFWVPQGMKASQGTYVHYPAEELYAILSLESHRHQAVIVGEDLGTVPPYVRPAMARHGLQRMYVVQYEVSPTKSRALPNVPASTVVSLNTHDMPTFAGFWQGADVRDREKMGLLDREDVLKERKDRRAIKKGMLSFLQQGGFLECPASSPMDVLKATLAYLSASPASAVLVNLEDLWSETRPQNVPSTSYERPNWRRKSQYTLEEFSKMEEVVDVLRSVNVLRNRLAERRKRDEHNSSQD